VAALVVVTGCGPDAGVTPPPPPTAPEIVTRVAAANPHNVLSVVVSARVRFADSVVVRYGLTGATLDSVAPAVIPAGDSVAVPVLGLLPDTGYSLGLVGYGAGGVVAETLAFHTGALPADLPHYVASGTDPSAGYVLFATARYGLVIDNTGRVVWYRQFPDGAGLNLQAQPTGRYYAHPRTVDPNDVEPWVELDPLGNVTRTFGCAGDLPSRFHDLIAEADGAYWVLCDEIRTMDLTSVGGLAGARVTGTVVQHVSAAGVLLFQWTPFDHFAITDVDSVSRAGANVNWTHGNALDLDTDGNLLVSFRSLSEITKIDARSGAVLWRMGGLRNQFSFLDAPTQPFARQHGLRVTGPGRLLLLDNLGDPAGSQAERYAYSDDLRAARLVASYGSTPAVTAQLGGTTQELAGARVLVSYGDGRRVQEYDASGRVVWQIEGDPGYVFRAQRIRSLYRPGVGSPH
jgi:hypothetical protein